MSSDSTDRKKPSHKKRRFTVEEDWQLQCLVNVHGEKWSVIAERMEGRTSRQCRERYKNYLNPSISHEKWTPEEDQCVREFVSRHPGGPINWAAIKLTGRTPNACKNRWNVHLKKSPTNATSLDSDSFTLPDDIPELVCDL